MTHSAASQPVFRSLGIGVHTRERQHGLTRKGVGKGSLLESEEGRGATRKEVLKGGLLERPYMGVLTRNRVGLGWLTRESGWMGVLIG